MDAIVIGAGPTGLTCALLLQQKGHKVKIIDQVFFFSLHNTNKTWN